MNRVLILEENAILCGLLSQILEIEGYAVLAARDGLTGIQLAVQRQPHLILCADRLPGLDGLQVTASLRASRETHGVPIIMTSSQDDIDNKRRAYRSGANGFLAKPFDVSEMLTQVKRFLPDPAHAGA